MVLDIHIPLPGAFASERVIIILHKTVHKIDGSVQLLDPRDVILIPLTQVSAAVILHQQLNAVPLRLVLSHSRGLAELFANLIYIRHTGLQSTRALRQPSRLF